MTPSGPGHSRFALRTAYALLGATVAWGAGAFGAVYPWAYWTLAALATSAGIAGHTAGYAMRRERLQRTSPSAQFVISLCVLAAAVSLQLLPLPIDMLERINPAGVALIRQLDLSFAIAPLAHSSSIAPPATAVALALYCSFALLLVGTARLASVSEPRTIVGILITIGIVVAFVGIIQKPLYAGKIYGLWQPRQGGNPFGPFVNKNHFAGFILMVLPLAIGYAAASVTRAFRHSTVTRRDFLQWLTTPQANKLALVATAIFVMGLALVLTLSRSGICAFVVALTVSGWTVLRRMTGRTRKLIISGYLVALAILVVMWAGAGTVVERFVESGGSALAGRIAGSSDALVTFQRHWLTGTGLNTYQYANLFYQRHDLAAFMSAAHNDYFQLGAEGGLLVLTPFAFCVVLFVRDLRRRLKEDRGASVYWIRFGALTSLIAIGVQETVEFSLQIPGNAALFAVICGLAIHSSMPHRRPDLRSDDASNNRHRLS